VRKSAKGRATAAATKKKSTFGSKVSRLARQTPRLVGKTVSGKRRNARSKKTATPTLADAAKKFTLSPRARAKARKTRRTTTPKS